MNKATAAVLTFLFLLTPGDNAAAQGWVEISAGESPVQFQIGGKSPFQRQDFVLDGYLPGNNGPSYFSVIIIKPDVSQLEIFLDRLGPVAPGASRELVLNEGNLKGRDPRNFEYIDCNADICARYRMGNVASCAAFSLEESPRPDQWRPHRHDRMQGFFCTKRKSPVSAKTINRVLAALSVAPRK